MNWKHLLLCLVLPITVYSQSQREFDLTLASPYNTVIGHLHYLQTETFEPAVAAQTLYEVSDSARASKLAIQLKQILDGKGLEVQEPLVPRDPNYQVDTTSNQFYYILFPEELPGVYVEKIDGKWYYTAETIDKIPALHKEVYPLGADILLNLLPQFGQTKILGLALWQYLGLAFLLVIAFLLYILLTGVLNPLVSRLSKSELYPSLVSPKIIGRITRYLSIFLIMRVFQIFLPTIQLPPDSAAFAITTIKVISITMVVLIILKILDIVLLYTEQATKKTESKLDEQLMPIIKRSLQAIIIFGGLMACLSVLKVNIQALLAGLSIGGLALALAAQDTLKNLFGSLTIFLDKPFQIGDWINFSDVDGTVEEVGFRSTRVRTFANSLVYVPNGKLADMVVNNYGLRVYRRFSTKLTIVYSTPPPLIEKFIEGLKQLVLTHPKTLKDRHEVYLNDLSANSLDILFYIFFDVKNWSEELKARHEILLAALELASQLGVQFAYPSTSIYIEDFPGNTSNKQKYETDSDKMEERLKKFLEENAKKHSSKQNF